MLDLYVGSNTRRHCFLGGAPRLQFGGARTLKRRRYELPSGTRSGHRPIQFASNAQGRKEFTQAGLNAEKCACAAIVHADALE